MRDVVQAFVAGAVVGVAFALVKLPAPAPSWVGVVGVVGIVAGYWVVAR